MLAAGFLAIASVFVISCGLKYISNKLGNRQAINNGPFGPIWLLILALIHKSEYDFST